VVEARTVDEKSVELRLEDGHIRAFDLVIFADGYQSMGRRFLFPEVEVQYRGYVAWRGFIQERALSESGPLESSMSRVCYKGMAGHLNIYFVPGPNGSVGKGERMVSWAAFLAIPPENLPRFLTDRQGQSHTHSLPPGAMRPEEEDRLKRLVREHLPTYYAEIIAASRDTFAQPIYIAEPPAYYRGRICMIGDAGAVAPPMTGSGVFKAMTNAISLAEAIRAKGEVDGALAEWNEAQTANGLRMTTWGRQLEQALIWATPDLSQLDATAAAEWWHRTAPAPPELTAAMIRPIG
jgi:2-polyprenyl-6-methoxyphenol hydroxylase-like FAD-dependent oxidoreductase